MINTDKNYESYYLSITGIDFQNFKKIELKNKFI